MIKSACSKMVGTLSLTWPIIINIVIKKIKKKKRNNNYETKTQKRNSEKTSHRLLKIKVYVLKNFVIVDIT